jgi:Trypsin-like peptidase domain/Tetratricopeptide Repeats-Sensor
MEGAGQAPEITTAIGSGDPDRIDRAVDLLLARLREDGDVAVAVAAGSALQSARRFDALLRLADTAARIVGPARSSELWLQAVVGLIELDATLTAERLVRSLLVDADTPRYRTELHGRLGRIKKDQWVDSGDPAVLRDAIDAYVAAYTEGGDRLWTGVNAIALRALAGRRGLPADDGPAIGVDEMLALTVAAPLPRSAWSLATELELRIARGEPTEALQPLLTQLFAAPDASGFVFASLARQLHEIWELDPADPLMVMLGERTLADGRGEVILPSSPDGYERTFGTEFPIPIELYREGIERARAVGSLLVSGAFCVGTVFAVPGDALHPSLGGRTVLVTNEHVVPDPARGEDRPQADEMQARFDGVSDDDGAAISIGGLRPVWRSPREELDVTLLLTDDPGAARLASLELADTLPRVRAGAYVYVIGHPGGGGLQLSIRGNDLIDEDGVRLHYKAPTAKGSSGSPVFDAAWKLIGVHHKGSTDLPALNGAGGTYAGNEGITMRAIREGIAQRPPEL